MLRCVLVFLCMTTLAAAARAQSGTCGAGADSPCLFGYDCVQGLCQPAAQDSCTPVDPNFCPPDEDCRCANPADAATCRCASACSPCGPGEHCSLDTRACEPDPAGAPDVTGVWYTAHVFDVSAAIPSGLAGALAPIASIEADLVHRLERKPALRKLGKALPLLVKNSVPTWVQTIIRIGDDIGRVLAMLRSEGSMNLATSSDGKLAGTETWSKLVFAWSPLCGDKGSPDCARFELAASDADEPAPSGSCGGKPVWPVGVSVGPFAAAVRPAGSDANGAQWRLAVSGRRAAVDTRRMVRNAIDSMLARTTPWQCLAEVAHCVAGQCLVDCAALEKSIAALAPHQGAFAREVCRQAVRAAVRESIDGLEKARFETDEMQLFGHARIAAERLGADDFATQLQKAPAERDGAWAGWFFSSGQTQPGAWEGSRPPKQ